MGGGTIMNLKILDIYGMSAYTVTSDALFHFESSVNRVENDDLRDIESQAVVGPWNDHD